MQDQGAASRADCHSAKIKKLQTKICEHTACQKLSPELNDIMIRPVKIINYS